MPKELDIIEEFDIITELQSPHYIYSIESTEEQIAFSKYINILPIRRILFLDNEILPLPFVVAGLTESHIETALRDGSYNSKKIIYSAFFTKELVEKNLGFVNELDRRQKSTDNSTRLNNIIQYLKDTRAII